MRNLRRRPSAPEQDSCPSLTESPLLLAETSVAPGGVEYEITRGQTADERADEKGDSQRLPTPDADPHRSAKVEAVALIDRPSDAEPSRINA